MCVQHRGRRPLMYGTAHLPLLVRCIASMMLDCQIILIVTVVTAQLCSV